MTGPEHYQEAERLVAIVSTWTSGDPTAFLREAQVHATLALAAATERISDNVSDFVRASTDGSEPPRIGTVLQ